MEETDIRIIDEDSTIIHIGQRKKIETIGRFDLSTQFGMQIFNAILVWVLDIDLNNVPTTQDSH